MGNFQQKELSGGLFTNDRKNQPNHPDFRGDCKIDGVEYWISAWIKSGAKGDFLSLAFTTKETTSAGRSNAASSFLGGNKAQPIKSKHDPFNDPDDDIPF